MTANDVTPTITGTRGRWQSRDRKGRQVTSCGRKDLEVTFERKSPGIGCRRPISQVLGMFDPLQGCNLHEVAVT